MIKRLALTFVLFCSLAGCAGTGGWFDFSGGLDDGTTIDIHKPKPEVPAEVPAPTPAE